MRVRITTDFAHRRSTDSYNYSPGDYSYEAAPSHNNTWATPRVVIDSQGLAHDPDFISNILSDQRELLAKRRAENDRRAKRLSQRGLIYDHQNSDSEDSDADLHDNFYTVDDDHNADPFAGPSTSRRRSAQSYFAETPNMEARRAARMAAAQSGATVHGRRGSFATTGLSPNARYPTLLSSPVSAYASETAVSMDTYAHDGSPASASEKWSLSKRWRKSTDDVRKTKPNTLKKKEPDQPAFVFDEDEEDEEQQRLRKEEEEKRLKSEEDEDTPTCGEALRRQWQSVVLRVTLATFRARRRLRPKKRHPELNEKYGT